MVAGPETFDGPEPGAAREGAEAFSVMRRPASAFVADIDVCWLITTILGANLYQSGHGLVDLLDYSPGRQEFSRFV